MEGTTSHGQEGRISPGKEGTSSKGKGGEVITSQGKVGNPNHLLKKSFLYLIFCDSHHFNYR